MRRVAVALLAGSIGCGGASMPASPPPVSSSSSETDLEERFESARPPPLVDSSPLPERPRVDPVAFSIDRLPQTRVPSPFTWDDAPPPRPRRTREVDEDGNERVLHRAVTFELDGKGRDAVERWTGWDADAIEGDHAAEGVECADWHRSIRIFPSRWQSIQLLPEGGALWTIGDGWFDATLCIGWAERLTRIRVASVFEEPILFAVRDRSGEDAVVFLMPAAAIQSTNARRVIVATPFGSARVAIRDGASFVALVPQEARAAFRPDVLPRGVATGLVIGVEVPPGAHDAIAYFADLWIH